MGMKKGKTGNDALEAILSEAGTPQRKMSKKKKIIIAAVAIVLAAAIAVGSVLIVKSKKNKETEPVYREYTVQRGDIAVGQTESSVITLDKETVTFPVGAEVLELYVRSGSHVSKGDPLIKMSIDDISDAIEDYNDDIKSAKAEVDSAKLNRKTELSRAEQTMEQSLLGGDQADGKYSQALAQAALELKEAQNAADEAQDKYNEEYSKSITFTVDYALLKHYETSMNIAENTADRRSGKQEEYNELTSKLSSVQSKIKQIADVSNMEQAQAYLTQLKNEYTQVCEKSGSGSFDALKAQEKVAALEGSMSTLESLFKEKESIEKEISAYDGDSVSDSASSAKEKYEKAKEKYNEYKADFTEKYGQIASTSDMNKSLDSANTALAKAMLNLAKQQDAYESALLQAEQTKETSDLTADTALQTYNLKKLELDSRVNDAVEQYDTLVEELDDILEAVGNDGVISAPCDGIISSLSVEEGDEVTAGGGDSMFGSASSATLMTVTDMSTAYVNISISEDEILDISLDQEASISLSAFPDETFEGKVDSISVEGSTMGAATVTYSVKVVFTQEGHDLYEGMSADVTLIEGNVKDVLYLSKQAITSRDGKSYVNLKNEDGSMTETVVKTGFTDGQYVEILSGLNEGDTVLAESALGTGKPSSGSNKVPDMGDFDMGDFDFSDMPSGGFGGMAGAPQ